MKQLSFLNNTDSENVSSDAFDYRPAIFDEADSKRYLQTFLNDVSWSQLTTVMYSREVVTPRLYAWFGDKNILIDGSPVSSNIWTPELLEIKAKVEAISGISFNSVLLNYYRDEHDSVAWHSDRDGIAGRNRFVASVSFGQARKFDLRRKDNHAKKFSVLLESGSYLLMKGEFQDAWEHRIAKSKIPMSARINLTFRITQQI